ncbi:nitric oxide reductase activation protein NorD [Paraburkholderia caffeinilytica]|uniref:nitric oxide reductase activation protein NorD n=1 Tax=Paraburkholderia caffeinilytica TaxID=1761016 RepID=UPI003DA0C8B6
MNAGTAVAASLGIDETRGAIASREAFPLTHFERTLGLYLRAAWQINAPVQALVRSEQTVAAQPCPILTDAALMLPREYEADAPDEARRFYLACVAHAAAHLTYSTVRFDPARLRPLQLTLVGVIEDARVERLAIARYPGLRRWWLPFHRTGPESSGTAAALIARLARGLLDPGYVDRDGWVTKGRALFEAAFGRTDGTDASISRHLGNLLGNDLGQMRIQFNAKTYTPAAIYRDDNSGLWDLPPTAVAPVSGDAAPERTVAPRESEGAGELPPDQATPPKQMADRPGDTPAAAAPHDDEPPTRVVSLHRYPEWDYVIRRYRGDWCSVESLRLDAASPDCAVPHDHAVPVRRVRAVLNTIRQHAVTGRTREFEGDLLDLDACIAGRIDALRGGRDRFKGFVTPRREARGVPLAILLDLSASNAFDGRIDTVLDVARVLGQALRTGERPYAMYGFHSDGRHRVRFHVFKDFDEAWSASTEAYIARIRPGLSTRFGAALRHAGTHVSHEAARMGLSRASLLTVSDCVPFDIDVFDPRYLREDTRRALKELAGRGIECGCLALDPRTHEDAKALFGRHRVAPLSDLSGLPAALVAVASR